MRHLLIDVSKTADIIPVDIPVNMMIAAAWNTATMGFVLLRPAHMLSGAAVADIPPSKF